MLFILFGWFGGITYFLFFDRAYWINVWEAVIMAALCAMGAWSGTNIMKLLKTAYFNWRKKHPPRKPRK